MSIKDIFEIWSLNQRFMSRIAQSGSEYVISEIWSLNHLWMSIKDILEIWSLNHFRMFNERHFWRFGASNHFQMSMKDIFGDLEPQLTFLPQISEIQTEYVISNISPEMPKLDGDFWASIKCKILDHNVSFRRFGASIITKWQKVRDQTFGASKQRFLYRNGRTRPQYDISDNWTQNQFQLKKNNISEIWSVNECFLSQNFEIRRE